MKTSTILICLCMIFFIGCSFKSTDRYKYRVNASNSIDSYKKYYLKGKTSLASVELKRAVEEAKEGSDIKTLAKIRLSECAIRKALLIEKDRCNEYLQIKEFLHDSKLEQYYLFLQGDFSKVNEDKIPKRYFEFIKAAKRKDFKKAFECIQKISPVESKLIAASLIKDHLSKRQIIYLIKESSSMGYKKATKRWYLLLKKRSTPKEKKAIDKKLKILD